METEEVNQYETEPDVALVDEVQDEIKEAQVEDSFPPKATKKRPWWVLLAVAGVLFTGILGYRYITTVLKENDAQTQTVAEEAKLPVKVVPAQSSNIQAWVFSDGFATAVTKKHLTFQVEGTITYLKNINGRDLREGDFVSKGELLAKVDQRKSNADITVAAAAQTEAKNQVLTAIANLRQAEEALAQAKADLQKAQTDVSFAEADLKRYQGLAEEGAIQTREVDVRQTEYRNAQAAVIASEAGVRSAQAQLDSAQTQVETAEAGVQSASARLTQSAVDREDTEIRAPFNGVVSRLNIREGDYWTPQIVNANADYQSIIERLPIIIISPNEFDIEVEFPAFQGAKVRPGQRAFILLDGDQSAATAGRIGSANLIALARERGAEGTVFSVSPSVSPGERSIRVTIRVSSGNRKLQDGQRVSVWIAVQDKNNATVAPFNAFIFRDQKPYVFVVNNDKGVVEQRQIQPGIEGLTRREIVRGVQPGELLVTEGTNRLVNGAPVEIVD